MYNIGEVIKVKKVFALIGDIIDSKSLENRKQIQNNLHELLDALNEKYESSIVSNLTLTLGDEFQGLFKDVESVLLVMDEIDLTLSLKGINVRFGVGYGEITTDINPELSIGADGEAYWFARDAITHIRKYHFSQRANERIELEDQNNTEFYNSIFQVQNALRASWITSQKELALTVIQSSGYETIQYDTIMKKMHLSIQSLSNRVGAASITQYILGRKHLAKHIEKGVK